MGERKRIGLREVRALQPGQTVWDVAVRGFGVRRQKSEAILYVLFYRTRQGRQRWYTIGRHGGALDAGDGARRGSAPHVVEGIDPAADKKLTGRRRPSLSYVISISPTRRPDGY